MHSRFTDNILKDGISLLGRARALFLSLDRVPDKTPTLEEALARIAIVFNLTDTIAFLMIKKALEAGEISQVEFDKLKIGMSEIKPIENFVVNSQEDFLAPSVRKLLGDVTNYHGRVKRLMDNGHV